MIICKNVIYSDSVPYFLGINSFQTEFFLQRYKISLSIIFQFYVNANKVKIHAYMALYIHMYIFTYFTDV